MVRLKQRNLEKLRVEYSIIDLLQFDNKQERELYGKTRYLICENTCCNTIIQIEKELGIGKTDKKRTNKQIQDEDDEGDNDYSVEEGINNKNKKI
jgi:hypothetical protein